MDIANSSDIYILVNIKQNTISEVLLNFIAPRIINLATYSYYYKMKNGGYHRETIDAQYTNIYEQEDCIPQVEKHKTLCKYRCPGLAKFLLFNNLKIVEIKNRWEYRRS